MKTIHHVCEIGATRDLVWGALTRQDGLAGWWSRVVSAPAPKVGAVIRFTFRGDFNPAMEITAVTPEAELVWKCVAGHENWADSTFRFQLEPLPENRTRLRFWQYYAVELADDYYGTYNFNWGYYLESLVKFCETGTGVPFE